MLMLMLLGVLLFLALVALCAIAAMLVGVTVGSFENARWARSRRHARNAPLPPFVDAGSPELRGDPAKRREIIDLYRSMGERSTNGHGRR